MVLLVATANVANAMLAKGLARQSELAIRCAIGGSGLQIGKQMLVESAILGVTGGFAGAAGAAFLLPYMLSLIPFGYVPAEAHVVMDWRIVALAAACATCCGAITGLIPAVRASRVDPAALLRRSDSRTGSLRHHWWREGFAITQLTMAVVVMGVAVAATANLRAAVERDPGYRSRDVWTARLALSSTTTPRSAETYRSILRRLSDQPAVATVALATLYPVGAQPMLLVSREHDGGGRARSTVDAASISVSPEFFRLLEIPLVQGRYFTADDDESRAPVAIVTRVLGQRLWPDGSAIGRRLFVDERGSTPATIVGVVGDVIADPAQAGVRPSIFFPLSQRPPAAVVVGVKTTDTASVLAIVRGAVRAVDPDIPLYSPDTLDGQRIAALGPRLLAVALLGTFAVTVLLLSSAGVHAVVSQSVEERRRELRIRLALGADPTQLFLGELRRSAALASIAVAIGSTVSAIAMRLLANRVAGFTGRSPAALFGAALVLFALAICATAWPAWRASHPQALN